jgi:hypothetical protein
MFAHCICRDAGHDEDQDKDPARDVMLRSIQDPELMPLYEGLPDLGYVVVIMLS